MVYMVVVSLLIENGCVEWVCIGEQCGNGEIMELSGVMCDRVVECDGRVW